MLASVLNNPTALDPANGKDAKEALKERYQLRPRRDGRDGRRSAPRRPSRPRSRLPKFPQIEARDAYGGQKGHVLKMVKQRAAAALGFNEEEIDGGGLRVTTTFTEKAMDAAEDGVTEARPEGFSDKKLHVGVATVEPGTGALRGFYGGQDYLESQINWAVAGGQAGSTFKPFALAAGIKEGFSLKDTFEGNSPVRAPRRRPTSRTRATNDYGSRST